MGYRHTLVSVHYGGNLPEWFKEKWGFAFYFNGIVVSSKTETKHYTNSFFEDYQKALKEAGRWSELSTPVYVAVMSGDGVVTKARITDKTITYTADTGDDVPGVDYYGEYPHPVDK